VTNPAAITSTKNTNLAARIGWTVLICATLYVCYFSHLGAIGFVGPDEPRYAWIAHDIAKTGDWVTPRLYGKPWFEKPPLYYWGAAICFKLFGVSEAAARLPSAISALLATLAMAWLAWRVYGAETARWLLLLLPTTVGMIGFSHAAATDMPFSAMLTIAMVCAAPVIGLVPGQSRRDGSQHSLDPAGDEASTLRDDRAVAGRRWLALILLAFSLGLRCWPGTSSHYSLRRNGLFLGTVHKTVARCTASPSSRRNRHLCLTALPWYILCARRNPISSASSSSNTILGATSRRIPAPPTVLVLHPIILIAFLPWTAALLWAAVIGALRAYQEKNQ